MPLTSAQQTALTAALNRLSNFYDGDNNYNPATFPGAFRQGGNVPNYVPSLKDVATVMQYASVLVADAMGYAASSPKAVRVDTDQTTSFSDVERAQARNNIGIGNALQAAVQKTGDVMTGLLTAKYGSPAKKYTQVGGSYDGLSWQELFFGNDGKFYLQALNADGSLASNAFVVGRDGSVATAQFGDLNARIENRASAYSAGAIKAVRLQYVGDLGNEWSVNGGFQTPYGSAVITDRATGAGMQGASTYYVHTFRWRQLQVYTDAAGWQNVPYT